MAVAVSRSLGADDESTSAAGNNCGRHHNRRHCLSQCPRHIMIVMVVTASLTTPHRNVLSVDFVINTFAMN